MNTEKEQEYINEEEVGEGGTEPEHDTEILTRELESREITISRLEQSLTAKDSEIADLKQSLNEVRGESVRLDNTLAEAVKAYRELTLQANPGVLAELITGDTVGDVDESLKNARTLMDKVRQEIEAVTSKARIPAGAPQRTPQDTSVLSPREKIQYAIGGASSGRISASQVGGI